MMQWVAQTAADSEQLARIRLKPAESCEAPSTNLFRVMMLIRVTQSSRNSLLVQLITLWLVTAAHGTDRSSHKLLLVMPLCPKDILEQSSRPELKLHWLTTGTARLHGCSHCSQKCMKYMNNS